VSTDHDADHRAAPRLVFTDPRAGEWLQQARPAVRARVRLDVLRDTIRPDHTFSEAFLYALEELGKPAAMAEAG